MLYPITTQQLLTIPLGAFSAYEIIVSTFDPTSWLGFQLEKIKMRRITTHVVVSILVTLLLFWIVLRMEPLKDQYPTLKPLMLADLLAFVAIVFAFVQFLDAQHEAGELGQQTDRLETLANRMSTKVVGLFPSNMHQITNLIERAEQSVQIIVDFPGYGQYSAPDDYIGYCEALKTFLGKKSAKLELVAYNITLATQQRLDRFPDGAQCAKDADSVKFNKWVEAFEISPAPNTNAELRTALQQNEETRMADIVGSKCSTATYSRKDMKEHVTLFLWLIDKREAIFTFGHVEASKEGSFTIWTADGTLVSQLQHYFNHTSG